MCSYPLVLGLVEDLVEGQVEDLVEDRVEDLAEDRAEDQVEDLVEDRAEDQVEDQHCYLRPKPSIHKYLRDRIMCTNQSMANLYTCKLIHC